MRKLLRKGALLIAVSIAIGLTSPRIVESIKMGFKEGWSAAFERVGVDDLIG